MRLLPAALVVGPVLGQVQLAVHQRPAALGDVAEGEADLAVLDLAQPAAPLPFDAAGGLALLGEATAVQDRHGVKIGERLGDVAAQLGQDGVVVPGPGPDEVLDRLAGAVGEVGDRLGGLAL
jgi:hypothetical protein